MRELTITDIQEIIKNDEGRTLEVKETTGEIVKAMCAACAFLNSDGGWLVFGVTPKLKIVGQQVTDNTKKEIANQLRKIEPSISVSVQCFEVSHSFVTLSIRFKQPLVADGGLNGGLELTERETQVVAMLREIPGQTIEEIAMALNISKRTMERVFAALKQKGIIEKEGSRKNGVWKIR